MVTTAVRTHHVTVHITTLDAAEVRCSCGWRIVVAKDKALRYARAHLLALNMATAHDRF